MKVSGKELLEGGDENLKRILLGEYMRRVVLARDDIEVFFELVMRRLDTNTPIKLAPHQRVGIQFILDHERSVHMWSVGASKTFLSVGLMLWDMGRNPTMRGCVVSATEKIARRVVVMVRDYIDRSPDLHAVFPHLKKSADGAWTDNELVIDRPRGIKDPTLSAYGIESGGILGTRLNRIVGDDILNPENTLTPDQRQKIISDFDLKVLSRLDKQGDRKAVVINTPFHSKDLVNVLIHERKWAGLRMDGEGDIEIWDDGETEMETHPRFRQYWDSPELRPAEPNNTANGLCRLKAHDPDPENKIPLWPEEMSATWLERERLKPLPVYNRTIRCLCYDDATAMCKQSYVDRSLALARELGIIGFVYRYDGPHMTFTGVDLAFSPSEKADENAIFTFEARPNGVNVILDIEVGRWSATETLDKCFQKHERYRSIVCVESNAAQTMIVDFARQRNASAPIRPRMTGRAKHHPEYGLGSFFTEMDQGAWAFPNELGQARHPMIEQLIRDCLSYVPDKHTPDLLSAVYMAREQKRDWLGTGGYDPNGGGDIGNTVMSR
jgi:hypothetical protein